jgi:hypothetical protein
VRAYGTSSGSKLLMYVHAAPLRQARGGVHGTACSRAPDGIRSVVVCHYDSLVLRSYDLAEDAQPPSVHILRLGASVQIEMKVRGARCASVHGKQKKRAS